MKENSTTINRETWLNRVAEMMAPKFLALGHPLPPFRVSVGFPSGGKSAPVAGECWDSRVSGDGHFEIFLNPSRDDSAQVAGTLAHELIHAAVGLRCGHKGDFAKVARALGFTGRLTHADPLGPDLESWISGILQSVGKIPHAALIHRQAGGSLVKRGGGGVVPDDTGAPDIGSDDTGDVGVLNSRPKPQTGRLIKAECAECGYTVRVTAKWLEIGPPHCPAHGAMLVAS